MEFLIIVLMLVLSAFFSGSEIAFVAANRLRVEVIARRRSFTGPIVQRFMHDPATFLTTTLVGNNLALVIYSTLMAFYLEPPLDALYANTLGLSETTTDIAVLSSQTLIASLLVLFFGEILPKSVLRRMPSRAVFVLAVPLRFTYLLLLPIIKVAGWMASFVARIFSADADSLSQFMRRDFELMIQEGKASGTLEIDEDESVLLSNVFALSSIRVKESMAPRTNVVAVDENTSIEDFLQTCISSGHSKLPVYEENIDRIVGIAFAYDLFKKPASLAEIIRPAQFVPETKLSKDLLQEFLAARTSVAIVIDEYGGTAGLVTMEDLLEELFGDIQDEFDTEDAMIRQMDEHTYIVSGRVDIDTLSERFGTTITEGDYDTIAGYLLERLGTIPNQKDVFDLDGYRFTILQATANRIDLVQVELLPD